MILSSTLRLLFLLSSAYACPFLRGAKNLPELTPSHSRRLNGHGQNPHRASKLKSQDITIGGVCLKRSQNLNPTKSGICGAYADTMTNFLSYITPLDDANRSKLYGAVVRLAFHDAGEYDQNWFDELGPDGCLSNYTDNAGLIERDGIVNTVVESMWQDVCDKISRADFWVMLAKIVIEESEPTHSISIPFQYGRIDAVSCDFGAGALPGAQRGIDEFQRVFVNQMGLTLHDAITLLGAHTLGHVHPHISGYGKDSALDNITTNAWDPTPHQFDNQYYQMLQRVSSLPPLTSFSLTRSS
jgi:hypothetical protein